MGAGMTDERQERRAQRRAERERLRAAREEFRRLTGAPRELRGRLIVVSALVAALLVFVGIAAFSPIMSVREIRVEGTQRLDQAELTAALDDLRGRPLALVTQQDVGARVAGFVLVQSYASRAQPPGALVVRITERQAIGALPADGGYAVYDAARVELWRSPAEPADVPALEVDGGLGGTAFDAAAGVSLALPAEFRATVQRVTARTRDDVELVLRTGAIVRWGGAEHSARKAEVLLALMAATRGQPIKSYDVSSPESPVTR